jgi:glycosyltransferase involved in cell wall biosynthesis
MCRKISRYFGVEREIGWVGEAEKSCATLSPQDVDVILASGPPFCSFQLAKRMAKKLRCRYVLDYRDPWAAHAGCKRSLRKDTRALEREVIAGASAITTVSESLLNQSALPTSRRYVVTNGYDPDEMAEVRPYEFGHFAIVYTGTFYRPKRVITPVMQALAHLRDMRISRTNHWRFHYYGDYGDHVREEGQRYNIEERVVIHGRVSRSEALSAVRGAGVAVVITSVLEELADQDGGIVTGKLFEPIGMKVPALVIGPSGSDVEKIVKTAGRARQVPASNIEGIASFLEEIMRGQIPLSNRPEIYAWPNIIKRLDTVLREASKYGQE